MNDSVDEEDFRVSGRKEEAMSPSLGCVKLINTTSLCRGPEEGPNHTKAPLESHNYLVNNTLFRQEDAKRSSPGRF